MSSVSYQELIGNGKQYIIEAVGVRNLRDFTTGKQYETINGIEEGIFVDRPYVTLIDDAGSKQSMHASRFKIIKEKIGG
jgi:hypothetical protein